MKLVQTGDYLIYFDNVRVDPYVINWNTTLGLTPGSAGGSIVMYRSPSLMEWKAYLTQVRVFTKNVFNGKYSMIFEGEITNRGWDDKRADTGKITYQVQGFYHWLDIPIPMMISTSESFDQLQNFMYEAQGINYKAVTTLFQSQEEVSLKNKNISQIIDYLFAKMNQGYYQAGQDNSAFGWAKMRDRFKVMVDVVQEYRRGGFLDVFTLISSTQIQTFYVYLTQILTQMMFEFYQDRDGTFRIKNPSWSEDILKNHVIDESLVDSITGMDNWLQEPTRVLAIGGTTDMWKQAEQSGNDIRMFRADAIPVGLYVGDAKTGEYYSATMEDIRRKYGLSASDLDGLGATLNTENWYDNVTGNYTITSPFTGSANRTDVAGMARPHRGTDYGMSKGTTVRNVGTYGTVLRKNYEANGGGNILVVSESIGGVPYEFKYMHLSGYSVKEGDNVSPGQAIAISGATGAVTGPHLHLEIWNMNANAPVDPDEFLRKAKDAVQMQQLQGKVGSSGSLAATGMGPYEKLMGGVSGFTSSLREAAQLAGVDYDLAKAYIAVLLDEDRRAWDTKTKEFRNKDILAGMLGPLKGVGSNNQAAIKQAIASKGDHVASRVVETVAQTLAISGGSSGGSGSYNAFSTTDGNNNPFAPKIDFFTPLRSGNLFNPSGGQPQQTMFNAPGVAFNTAWADFEATAYIATCPGCTGITRTGLDVRDTSKDYQCIAVDPSVIPLHSMVEIEGPRGVSGIYYALDTGGAIKGRRIDILMSTYNKAMAFGREPIKVRIIRLGKGDGSTPSPTESPRTFRSVKYAANNELIYPMPPQGNDYVNYIKNNAGHVDPNMLCAIIDVLSSWRPSFVGDRGQYSERLGLMGVPKSYADDLSNSGVTVDWLDGNRSVEFGSTFFGHCMEVLRNKPTLALAAYYLGNPQAIDDIAQSVKSYDYLAMKDLISMITPKATTFVEQVLEIYLTLMKGDYIDGDPHKDFGKMRLQSHGLVNRVWAKDTNVDGFTNKFALQLSPEELRFKMNLKIVEQRLIRYDSAVITNGDKSLINQLIFKYAKYMMQVYRAASHNININLAVCLPFIRPGFNVWVEPSRSNVVAYVTGVSHQGIFSRGCYTSIQAEFVRTPSTFNDIDESIFIGERFAKSSDFGPTIAPADMDGLRKQLVDLNGKSDEVVDDAHNVATLRDLYTAPAAGSNASQYVTEWNSEYTKDEIDSKIKNMYASAPSVITDRMNELQKAITASEDFFIAKLMADFSK